MLLSRSLFVRALLAGVLPLAASCSKAPESTSDTLVTDVAHTVVKRQSIGNCWIYAQATWLESKLLTQTGTASNVSESYWTWWHWYGQIVNNAGTDQISTGGFWQTSANIIVKHGYVLEGEFIEGEADKEMSAMQAQANAYIDAQLQPGGKLGTLAQRSAANVRKELDIAFGTDMAHAESLARPAATTLVAPNTTLAEALNQNSVKGWKEVGYPRLSNPNLGPSASTKKARKNVLKRVMKALNDRQPVVMSLMIDFNAMDAQDNGTFKLDLLQQNGLGHQGGHMLVLEDYTVANVPGIGVIGEGDMSPELKAKALNGTVTMLKSKNSWGSNRPERGLTDGYTRFQMDYLDGTLEWYTDEDQVNTYFRTTLTEFILPPGY